MNPTANERTRKYWQTARDIDVTHHAKLRFLQRVSATVPNPAEAIRRMVAQGEIADDVQDVEGKVVEIGEWQLVFTGPLDSPTVITVLNGGDSGE